jgi:hypothetical protein
MPGGDMAGTGPGKVNDGEVGRPSPGVGKIMVFKYRQAFTSLDPALLAAAFFVTKPYAPLHTGFQAGVETARGSVIAGSLGNGDPEMSWVQLG